MSLERLTKFFLILLAVGSLIYVIQMNIPRKQAKGIIAVTVAGNMALWWGAMYVFDRRRRAELTAALTRRGLSVGERKSARFIHILRAGQRALTGKFWAYGDDAAGHLNVAEFTYLTGSGKHTRTHRNIQVSRPFPPPPAPPSGRWPYFHLTRRPRLLQRSITDLISPADYGLENEAFGKRWTIICDDRDFVLLLLSPIIQDWLMLSEKDESWTIAQGNVCITREHKCNAAEIDAMIARLDEFLAMVPEELVAYESTRSR